MPTLSNHWVRRAYLVGIGALALFLLFEFVDALFQIFDGPLSLVEKYPTAAIFGILGSWGFVACTFVLWLKSWQLVFPGKTVESGFGPLVWFFLLTAGFFFTPWYVCYKVIKEDAI